MGKTEKKNQKKRVPTAPLAVGGPTGAATTVKKPVLFEKNARNYRIGGDIQPKRNLTRFTKWPQYIRLQRQKRILLQRLKVPPSISQFQKTCDKNQMSQIARLCKKIAPETKVQKKQRLKEMASTKSTDNKAVPTIKFGINHVTELVENKKAKLVVIAHDVDPVELVVWLPTLCRKKGVAFCIVKSKARLGQLVGKKTATCCAFVNTAKEDTKDLDTLVESCTAAFNDNKDMQRHWGGGIFGRKSQHVINRRAALLEKENAKKSGM